MWFLIDIELNIGSLLENIEEHLDYLFCYEGDGPGEYVHEIWQDIWVRCVVKLLNVKRVLFKFDYRTLVIINIAIVRS